MIKRLAK